MRGYTLIEILITMLIMALLMSVGLLSYRDLTRRQNIMNATRQLTGDLRLLQNDSLSGRKPAGCNGTLNSYNFRVVNATPITTYVEEAECAGPPLVMILVKQAQLPSGTNFTALPSINPVRFKTIGDGTNIPSNQSVVLTVAGSATTFTQRVTIEYSGSIR